MPYADLKIIVRDMLDLNLGLPETRVPWLPPLPLKGNAQIFLLCNHKVFYLVGEVVWVKCKKILKIKFSCKMYQNTHQIVVLQMGVNYDILMLLNKWNKATRIARCKYNCMTISYPTFTENYKQWQVKFWFPRFQLCQRRQMWMCRNLFAS